MRVGPSLGANGMLEFILDPDLSRDDRYLGEEPSTGKEKRKTKRNFKILHTSIDNAALKFIQLYYLCIVVYKKEKMALKIKSCIIFFLIENI